MSSSLSILSPALYLFEQQLQHFATSPEFVANMALSFGESHDYRAFEPIFTGGGRTGVLNLIEILPSASLNGAYGAFSRDTNKIYLASEYVTSASVTSLSKLLLEEYGHYIDARLNSVETVGDEGEIFADLVQRNPIDPAAITEDDTATITLNGTPITIEQGSPIVYVRQGAVGSNNGTSWVNAYNSLATALTNAPAGSEIWVAQGTYKPTTTLERDISFNLKNLVEVYGGFNGTETARNQRNIGAYPTILSGDIGAPNDKSDNSYTVVVGNTLSASTVLDGFTITDGNNTDYSDKGAGFYLSNSSPILANLNITNNSVTGLSFSTSGGGGGYIENGIPQLINISFTGNTTDHYGGALNLLGSNAILTNINFFGNSATEGAGALFIRNSNPVITNSNFTSNTATGNGGAIYVYDSSPQLTNVRFVTNSANNVGGGIATSNGSPNLFNVIFERNSSTSGGGIYFDNRSFFDRYTPTLTNIVFDRNTANSGGGGIYNQDYSPTITNVTFSNNTAATGSAIQSDGDRSQAAVTNSILWNDRAATGNTIITNTDSGRTIVNDSLVQGGYPSSDTTNPNLDANPLFVDASSGNLRLQGLSPAINAGSNDAVTGISTDLAGGSRIVNGTVDLGAYEFSIDLAQYGASYRDLIQAFGYNLSALEDHYFNAGRFEGRQPDLFDEYRYIASNADLLNAFGANGAAATYHYITSGYYEGRSLTSFDAARYLLSNPDLLNAYGTNIQSASYHYVAYGSQENRNPNAFPSDRYIASNSDLIQTFGYNLVAGSEHYLYRVYTGAEIRPISFSPESYLSLNPDVAAHPYFGQSLTNATQHYILYGFNEGRSWA